MAYSLGLILGIIFAMLICSISSYFIWEKYTKDRHTGKKMLMSFISFFAAGGLGLIGGLPFVVISFFWARVYKDEVAKKKKEEDSQKIAG